MTVNNVGAALVCNRTFYLPAEGRKASQRLQHDKQREKKKKKSAI